MSRGNPQANGRTKVIGPRTSNIIWQVNKSFGTASGPVICFSDILYFPTSWNKYVYAMSTDTLNLWKYEIDSPLFSYSGMILDSEENLYFGAYNGCLYSLNSDGLLNWKFKTGDAVNSKFINIGLDSTIYFSSSDGFLYAVDNNGESKWKQSLESGFNHTPAVLSPDGQTITPRQLTVICMRCI
ncbi:MAG: PQQ-like beta-propeller repeat protein [Melioribacteraceae bacterium]|nr:PQQ-like beta-propeller repeat protein [Melioribacteraceae bacterium]